MLTIIFCRLAQAFHGYYPDFTSQLALLYEKLLFRMPSRRSICNTEELIIEPEPPQIDEVKMRAAIDIPDDRKAMIITLWDTLAQMYDGDEDVAASTSVPGEESSEQDLKANNSNNMNVIKSADIELENTSDAHASGDQDKSQSNAISENAANKYSEKPPEVDKLDELGFNFMTKKGVASILFMESSCSTALAEALELMLKHSDELFTSTTSNK
jgi:hypothetical protein